MSKPNPFAEVVPKVVEPVEDAYAVFVRNAVQDALNDPRPPLTGKDADAHMAGFKAALDGEFKSHFGFEPE